MEKKLVSYRIGRSIPEYDISEGDYCSHWGLDDLYPECEANLRGLIESGEDFRTGWCGCKKEIVSARYSRMDGHLRVEVCQSMDDLYEQEDLIYDALWDETRREDELTEGSIEQIRDAAAELGIEDSTSAFRDLPANATYEDLVAAAEDLWVGTTGTLDTWYVMLREIVRDLHEFKEED